MLLKQELRERAKLDGVLYWQDRNDQCPKKKIKKNKKKFKKNPNPLVNDEEKKKTQPTNQNKSHRRLSFDLQAKAWQGSKPWISTHSASTLINPHLL